jgi:hypothetical protein
MEPHRRQMGPIDTYRHIRQRGGTLTLKIIVSMSKEHITLAINVRMKRIRLCTVGETGSRIW